MIYYLVKYWVLWSSRLFFGRIVVTPPSLLQEKGPAILACNHPNSFLDAIILACRMDHPIHFLARGDAFEKPWVKRFFAALRMIPIFRLSEGKDQLSKNDKTFHMCREVLAQKGIVLIFSEGLCRHEWTLRPLKKGTSRIATACWDDPEIGDALRVIPIGFNYSSFRGSGKSVFIDAGKPFGREVLHGESQLAKKHLLFNNHLAKALQPVIHDQQAIIRRTRLKQLPTVAYVALIPLAIAGIALNGLLYLGLRRLTHRLTAHSVFYDSVLFGTLLLTYPLYLMLLTAFAASLFSWPIAFGLAALSLLGGRAAFMLRSRNR